MEQVRWACEAGLPRGVVLLDAGYGNHTNLRTQISALALTSVAGILSSTSVWAPATKPLPPKRYSGRGRPPTRPRRGKGHKPISVKELAFSLPVDVWRTVTWREGSSGRLSSRFARVQYARPAAGGTGEEEWLLVEWPKAQTSPRSSGSAALPHDIAWARMIDLAKLRWRIERDYQELKQELGLGHFEGRSWRGFHHHATMCIAAYGFLISEQEMIAPSAPRAATRLAQAEASAPITAPRRRRRSEPSVVPNSIATMRRRLIVALIRRAPRCPCCARRNARHKRLHL